MTIPTYAPYAVVTLLVALGVVPGWGVLLALPLAALLVAAAIWINRPRSSAWLWIGIGSAFWVAEEVAWAILRIIPERTFTYLTDPLYFTGVFCWFVGVMLMDHRAFPKFSLIVALPALGFIGWLLTQNFSTALFTRFPLLDLALLVAAIPAIERSFYGELPEGRLLWLLGLFGRVLAGSLFIWLNDYSPAPQVFLFLWLVSYTFIAIGVWIELSGVNSGVWSIAYGLLGLEAVTGLVIAMTLAAHEGSPRMALIPGLFLGYLLFVGMMLLVIADRNRRIRAEESLRKWSSLLEVLASLPTSQDHATSLEGISDVLRREFPDLIGITAEAGGLVHLEDAYPYPVVAEGAEVGRLLFKTEPDNMAVLDTISPSLAAHLVRISVQQRWYDQALSDPLTGLSNRRIFELRGMKLVTLASRQSQPMSLAVLDIDHFKHVNDRYGHPTGDEVLKAMAGLLQQHTREQDLALRWGGEEFVLLLYGSDLEQASQIVERIRAALQEMSLGLAWPVTVSGGLAGGIIPTSGTQLYQWLALADQALLGAKRGGRNQLVVVPLP